MCAGESRRTNSRETLTSEMDDAPADLILTHELQGLGGGLGGSTLLSNAGDGDFSDTEATLGERLVKRMSHVTHVNMSCHTYE